MTEKFILDDIPGEPYLMVAPAQEANKPYLNARLRTMGKGVKALKKKLTASTVTEAREQDVELFAKYVVKGWEGVRNSEGEEAEFTVENCEAFLAALPSYIFDKLRDFATDPDSFITVDDETLPEK